MKPDFTYIFSLSEPFQMPKVAFLYSIENETGNVHEDEFQDMVLDLVRFDTLHDLYTTLYNADQYHPGFIIIDEKEKIHLVGEKREKYSQFMRYFGGHRNKDRHHRDYGYMSIFLDGKMDEFISLFPECRQDICAVANNVKRIKRYETKDRDQIYRNMCSFKK